MFPASLKNIIGQYIPLFNQGFFLLLLVVFKWDGLN